MIAGIGACGGTTDSEVSTQGSDIEECARCDGDWGVHGLSQSPSCNCRTKDAGERCSGSAQCDGACLVDGQEKLVVEAGPPPRGYFVGQCAEFTVSYGCHDVASLDRELLNLNEPPPTICFD